MCYQSAINKKKHSCEWHIALKFVRPNYMTFSTTAEQRGHSKQSLILKIKLDLTEIQLKFYL